MWMCSCKFVADQIRMLHNAKACMFLLCIWWRTIRLIALSHSHTWSTKSKDPSNTKPIKTRWAVNVRVFVNACAFREMCMIQWLVWFLLSKNMYDILYISYVTQHNVTTTKVVVLPSQAMFLRKTNGDLFLYPNNQSTQTKCGVWFVWVSCFGNGIKIKY